MSKQLDMTPQPDLSQKTGTGPVRTRLPVWRPALPPCNHACPAGENIQAWLALAEAGRFEAAWQTLIEENPLPAIHGRVCYHPCESACNRAQVDDAVSIHAIERFLGDEALARGWQPMPPAPASGKKVLVIGAGPSGLSCAWHLNRLGHRVEIREAGPLAGGMLRFGIPAYRLPREVLDREVARILARPRDAAKTRKDAAEALQAFIEASVRIGDSMKTVGEYAGHPLRIEWPGPCPCHARPSRHAARSACRAGRQPY